MQSTAALALIAPGVALAQLPGEIYLGLGAGEASYDASGVTFNDDKDTGWKAFAGFDINRIIGIEAGYVDLGTATLGGNAEADVTGFNIDARVGAPVGPVSVFAKAGTYYSDVEVSAPGLGSADDQSWELTYGAGAEFDFAKNMAVRAEWERFELNDQGVLREPEVDLLSASLVFKFK
jgi:OOP family OmpA-OmpF porin